MFDVGHLPVKASVRYFFAQGGTEFQSWAKPPGHTMANFWLIGSGAGGGGGCTGAAGSARGGGGGGGGGAIARIMSVPLQWLPDILWARVPFGGAGAAAGGTGTSGASSQFLISAINVGVSAGLFTSGGTTAVGGSPGTASAGGAGGAGQIVYNFNGTTWGSIGTPVSNAGQAGVAGGAHTGAVGVTATWSQLTSVFLSGGAGGGGTPIANIDYAGGGINGGGLIPTLAGGLAAAGSGDDGFELWKPIAFSGGCGGGTAGAAGTAGAGGDGQVGCGGGGGGGGVTGGAGGRGGPGLAIIVSW